MPEVKPEPRKLTHGDIKELDATLTVLAEFQEKSCCVITNAEIGLSVGPTVEIEWNYDQEQYEVRVVGD